MKVNHLDDYDTHAVIGGKKGSVVEFKMAQTAEFFTILSSTLYSDKPLAVVREVLCNAWDSHIVSGITDKPVNINLSSDSLTIRDYGKGIHPDNMQDIYCTYGNSTKANDGNQTGGFGLGSKAPFAYSDHFSVTSYHEGVRTVYAISRGSQLTQGKPDMRIMVQVPTTESGLEVNIPVKSPKDRETFEKIIEQIASMGEMNVFLNGGSIEIVPISKSPNNMFITSIKFPHDSNPLHVRYGNVVYPIPPHEDYIKDYESIKEQLGLIPNKRYYSLDWKVILQTVPNSISVTPSRESLSLTETTINTIKNLLKELKDKLNLQSPEFSNLLIKYIDKKIDQFWLRGEPNKLLTQTHNVINEEYVYPKHLSTLEDIADLYIAKSSRLPKNYIFNDMQSRLQSLINNNYRRKQDLYYYKKMLKVENKIGAHNTKINRRFNKLIIRPIIKSLIKHPILKLENMFITTQKVYNERNPFNVSFKSLTKANLNDDERNSILLGVIIISSGKAAYDEYYKNSIFGQTTGQYVYITPRNLEHRQAAKDHFTKLGFHVIDFISSHENYLESIPKIANAAPVITKPKVEGIVTLESLIRNKSFKRNGHRDDKFNHKRITDPEFIFKPHSLSGSEWSQKFFEFGDKIGYQIVSLIGSKGGIVVNDKQYDHYLKKGAKNGYEYLIENITNEMLTNPRIQSYLELLVIDERLPDGLKELMDMADHSSTLKRIYNLPSSLREEDKVYIDLYQYLKEHIKYYNTWETIFRDAMKKIEDIKPSTNIYNLIDRFNENKMTSLINWDDIKFIMIQNPNINDRVKLEMLIISVLGN